MPVIINGSTGVSGTDGSASTPAVQGTDTNTGMFFPAADTIAFAEGGVEAMRLDSSGNVGVGTTAPSAPLTVKARASDNVGVRVLGSSSVGAGYVQFTDDPVTVERGAIIATSGGNLRVDGASTVEFFAGGAERARVTSTGDFRFNSGYGSVTTAYGCRAWVNFNGQGTVAIRASGNVSSITDYGTGEYGIFFATSMVDANYSAVVAHSHWGGVTRLCDVNADGYFVNQFSMIIVGQQTTSWAQFDPGFVCVSIFR